MAMRPTRKIIIEFVGVFSVGALAGGLVTWNYTNTELSVMQFPAPPSVESHPTESPLSRFMSHTNDPEAMVARMSKKYADEYHLTADEQNRIRPLLEEMAQHTYQERRQFGLDIMATLDDYHGKIAAQMDPDHRVAYEKACAERRKTLSSMLLLDQNSTAQESR
jgi:uncharacterized membrane protein